MICIAERKRFEPQAQAVEFNHAGGHFGGARGSSPGGVIFPQQRRRAGGIRPRQSHRSEG